MAPTIYDGGGRLALSAIEGVSERLWAMVWWFRELREVERTASTALRKVKKMEEAKKKKGLSRESSLSGLEVKN